MDDDARRSEAITFDGCPSLIRCGLDQDFWWRRKTEFTPNRFGTRVTRPSGEKTDRRVRLDFWFPAATVFAAPEFFRFGILHNFVRLRIKMKRVSGAPGNISQMTQQRA